MDTYITKAIKCLSCRSMAASKCKSYLTDADSLFMFQMSGSFIQFIWQCLPRKYPFGWHWPRRWVGGHSSRCNLQCWSVGSDGKDYLYGKPSQDHTHSHLQKIALFCSPVAECSWDQDWTDIWVRLVNERTYLAFNCNFFILQNNAKARFGCSMISSFPQVPIGIRTVVIC